MTVSSLSGVFMASFPSKFSVESFQEYQTLAEQTVTDSLSTLDRSSRTFYACLGLCGEAGEAAEKMKKVIRDHGGQFPSDTAKRDFLLELGDVLWYITDLATQLGVSLEDIAGMNIDKLMSRMARGALHGSGDAR